ncbi:MAG: DNA polymerase III subunit delta' [Bdellovibrionales bacterium]|nr:DNA polymerase III subunit delta' [Bdellovibrionales bacterium]
MAQILKKVVGHESQIQMLLQALEQQRFPSTLLFVGQSGIGKKLVAQGFIQYLVCEKDRGCGSCPACLRVENGQSESFLHITPESGVIRVDKAREIISFISLQNPGKARIILIEDAQLMNEQTANALLKSLEEPPERTYFILLVPSIASVLPTIRSRAQVVRFGALPLAQLEKISQIKEEWILKSAQGSVELAEQLQNEDLSLLRQRSLDIWVDLLEGAPERAIETVKELVKDRQGALQVCRIWQQLLRDSGYYRHGVHEVIHKDFVHLIQRLADYSDSVLGTLGVEAYGLEQDIRGNLDRSLAFENYLYQSQNVFQTDTEARHE